MKRIILIILLSFSLILISCTNNQVATTNTNSTIKKAEQVGLVKEVNKKVEFEDFIYKITKVYNDVTGYQIYYAQNKLDKEYDICFEFTDNLGNTYQTLGGFNERTSGMMSLEPIRNYDVTELYIDVIIYETVPLNNGAYREKIDYKKRVVLPVDYPPAYMNSIVINNKYNLRLANTHIDINNIAFGKTSTLIEYDCNPEYVKVDKVIVNNSLYDTVTSGGSSSDDTNWDCSGSFDAVNNPKSMEIYFSDEKGNCNSVFINIK